MASPTVVLLPLWAPGHLSSMLEAGKRLLHHSNGALSLTVLLVPPPQDSDAADVTSQIDRELASHDAVTFHRLPPVARVAGEAPVAAVVVDWFGTMLLDVARELAVPGYVYFTSTAALLSLVLRLPAALGEVTVALSEAAGAGAVDVPGLPAPVPAACMPSPVENDYAWFAYHGRRLMDAEGIVVNTAAELEPRVLEAIADGRCAPGRRVPTLYPIGPVLPTSAGADDRHHEPPSPTHECMRWLDAQPAASVVFLCFGSRGWMGTAQAREVAAGLARSGHRFLWVLRGPPADAGTRYPTDADLDALLPDGFLDDTKDRGLVWPRWAPQQELLAHLAVGGFVTHCGWNSVLESLWHGVPMAPCPLYAEQPLNAFEIVACMGVAVELRARAGRDVGNVDVEAAELERAVRSLMGGDAAGRKARVKAQEMKDACRKAVEEGGSSHAATKKLAREATHRPGNNKR